MRFSFKTPKRSGRKPRPPSYPPPSHPSPLPTPTLQVQHHLLPTATFTPGQTGHRVSERVAWKPVFELARALPVAALWYPWLTIAPLIPWFDGQTWLAPQHTLTYTNYQHQPPPVPPTHAHTHTHRYMEDGKKISKSHQDSCKRILTI